MLRKFALVITLTFGSFQAHAEGLDLNDALLGCVRSGGECLTHTGIPVIDSFFSVLTGTGNYQMRDYRRSGNECRDLLSNWCSGGNGGNPAPGFSECRKVKQAFYKQQRIRKGDWPESFGFRPNSRRRDTEEEYLAMLEREWLPRHGDNKAPYFTCNQKQREIYIKVRCGKDYTKGISFDGPTYLCESDHDDD